MLDTSSLTRTAPVGSTVFGKLTLLVKGLKTHFIRTKLTAGRTVVRSACLFLGVLLPTIGTRLIDPCVAGDFHTRLQNQNLHPHQQEDRAQRNRHIGKPWNGIQRIENAHIV